MNDHAHQYTAAHIQVLEGVAAVRKRPGMYVGSTGVRGLHNLVFESTDWAVKQVLAGHAEGVAVVLEADGDIRVTAEGRGGADLATSHAENAENAEKSENAENAEGPERPSLHELLTQFARVGRIGRRSVSVGLFGLGPVVTNALSRHLTGETDQAGVRWTQRFECGAPVGPPSLDGPATGAGTVLVFRPDTAVFGTATCSFDDLAERFRMLTFLNRGLRISLIDRRESASGGTRSESFHFPGGLKDFVAFLMTRAGVLGDAGVFGFETEVEVEAAAEAEAATRVGGGGLPSAGSLEVALGWSDACSGGIRSFANSQATLHGDHILGLWDGVAAAVETFARENRMLDSAAPGLEADSVADALRDGLTVVVSVRLDHPRLGGSTRERLDNPEVRAPIAAAVAYRLGRWFAENPGVASAVADRVLSGRRRAEG
ncbi:DNA gyrase subunit B [Streptomyces sp. NPDC048659]|uniref:DNA gyrase subunit B n=1 Tax=Streptomyces sp. NPDC048659 TaxID=3155489 RepID=UPI00341BBA54